MGGTYSQESWLCYWLSGVTWAAAGTYVKDWNSSACFLQLGTTHEFIHGKFLHKSLAHSRYSINVSSHYYYSADETNDEVHRFPISRLTK